MMMEMKMKIEEEMDHDGTDRFSKSSDLTTLAARSSLERQPKGQFVCERTSIINGFEILERYNENEIVVAVEYGDDEQFQQAYSAREELSLERGESSSYQPPEEYSDDTDDSYEDGERMEVESNETLPKKNLASTSRQKFRRWRHKEYQCDECDRMFTLKHNLQNHFVQYHMGCKTLHKSSPSCKCPVCGKIYSAAAVLAEHMLHEHDKLADQEECTVCHEKFLTRSALQKHMREHARVLKTCPYDGCKGRTFRFSKELNEHVRVEHKLTELSCSECNMVFRQLSAKNKHDETHHKSAESSHVSLKRPLAEEQPGTSEDTYRKRRGAKAKCDEDLVKREPSPTPPTSPAPRNRNRQPFRPEFEAVAIKKKTTKRLTKEEILAKIK
uniref:C2H2-type domain-containing protein n=1 Tax=Caenorhabditis japonica TaxID=281687 RepID=A0A8R1HXA5_CAEJA